MTPRLFRAVAGSGLVTAAVVLEMFCPAGTALARGASADAYAYVLLAPGSPDGSGGPLQALARVVIGAPAHPCPTLSPGPRLMTTRANPNPSTFAVTVCEAVYPFDQALTVTGFKLTLPSVGRQQPQKILLLGDTGCRNDASQNCTRDWPFGAFATAAAQLGPELILHVGDYNYRGTPGKVDKEHVYDGCAMAKYVTQNPRDDLGSASWDRWEHWRDDFFKPAAPLLSRAPWVFVRGNHELCSRAGPGYFYFLDPHSPLLGHDPASYACPPQVSGGDPSPNLTFVPPYALPFGGGLTLIVVDSANACDTVDPVSNAPAIYAAQFGRLNGLIQTPYAWLATHRPIWGVDAKQADMDCAKKPDDCLNATMQQAIRANPGGSLPPTVQLLLAGHLHRFESVTFDTVGRPPQLVNGASGVQISGALFPSFTAEQLDGQSARGPQLNQHGFFDLQLQADGTWQGQLLKAKGPGSVLAVCGTAERAVTGSICRLTGN